MEAVIENLEELGFFEAPASTKFHLNVEGGLLEHSWNVCNTALMLLSYGLKLTKDEMLAIRWHMTAWDLAFQSPEQRVNLQKAREIANMRHRSVRRRTFYIVAGGINNSRKCNYLL